MSGRTSSPSGSHITRSTSGLAGAERETAGSRPTTGTMWLRLTTVLRWSSSANSVTSDGIEADLLVGLAQRGLGRRLAGVRAAAGEADLALVVAHVAGAAGEQDLGALLAVGEGDEHGGRPGVGERRGDRPAGRPHR